MAPPHTKSTTRPADDLDDLFNFLDADTTANTSQNPNKTTTTDENAAPPTRRRLDGDDPLGLGLGIDEEIKVRKPRAPVAKLDEERLLSDMGIPRLRRITKDRLRFKGKGHEVWSEQWSSCRSAAKSRYSSKTSRACSIHISYGSMPYFPRPTSRTALRS
jgi:hypothetical protein